MTIQSLKINLPDRIGERLKTYSKKSDCPQSEIVTTAVEEYLNRLDGYDIFVQEVLEAKKDVEKGEFISQEATKNWLRSLGTENELDLPEPDIFIK